MAWSASKGLGVGIKGHEAQVPKQRPAVAEDSVWFDHFQTDAWLDLGFSMKVSQTPESVQTRSSSA